MPRKYLSNKEYRYEWDTLYLKCTKCSKRKTLDRFPKDKSMKFWVRSACKECKNSSVRMSRREWYEKHKERIKQHYVDYYNNNKQKIIKRMNKKIESNNMSIWFDWYSFHWRTKYYIKKHNLRPDICPVCWVCRKIEAHHPFYREFSDWSYVVFCCKKCHKGIHNWEIKCPEYINLLECGSPLKEYKSCYGEYKDSSL